MDNFGDQFVPSGASVQNALLNPRVCILLKKFKLDKSVGYALFSKATVKVGLQVMPFIAEDYMGTNLNSPWKYRSCA